MTTEPVLREQCEGYIREWWCEPPPLGTKFKVYPGKEEWMTENEVPVRRIYKVELVA